MGNSDQMTAEKTYRAIGRFIFEFSQVEYAIRHYLAEEIELKGEHFSAVVESYDVAVLTNVAKKVFKKTRDAKNGAQIDALLSRFYDLNGERQHVAHGLWVPFMDGGTVHYVSRNSLKSSQLSDQAQALEKLADDACGLRAALEHAFMAMPEVG